MEKPVTTPDYLHHFYCLVVGSRSITDYAFVRAKLDEILAPYAPDIVIVSGGARGVDSLAEAYAEERGYIKAIFPADWDRYGKSAGYRRNVQMHKYLVNKNHNSRYRNPIQIIQC